MKSQSRLIPYLFPLCWLAFTLYECIKSGYFTRILSSSEAEALYGVSNLVAGDYFSKRESLHPPLTYALLTLWSLVSDSEVWMRTLLFLCYSGTTLLLFRWLLAISGILAAGIAVTLFGLSYHKVFLYVSFLNYALPFLASVVLLCAHQSYRQSTSPAALSRLALFSGISVLFHYGIFFLAVAVWLCIFIENGGLKKIPRQEIMACLAWFIPCFLLALAHHLFSGTLRNYLEGISLRESMSFPYFVQGLYTPTSGLFRKSILSWLPPFLVSIAIIAYNLKQPQKRFPVLRLLGICWLAIATASVVIKYPWTSTRHLFVLILPLYAVLAIGGSNLLEILLHRCIKQVTPTIATASLVTTLSLWCVARGTSSLWYPGNEPQRTTLPQFLSIWEQVCRRPVKGLGFGARFFLGWHINRQPFGGGSRLAIIPLRSDGTFNISCPPRSPLSQKPLSIFSPRDVIKPGYPLGTRAYSYANLDFY